MSKVPIRKLRARLVKLKAIAKSLGSTPEGRVARNQARRIEAEIRERGLKLTKPKVSPLVSQRRIPRTKERWMDVLLSVVLPYVHAHAATDGDAYVVYGQPADLDRLEELLTRARSEIIEEAQRITAPGPGRTRAERNAFCHGAANGFGDRIEGWGGGGHSKQLPVLVTRQYEAQVAFAEAYDVRPSARAQVTGSEDAFGRGRSFGHKLGGEG